MNSINLKKSLDNQSDRWAKCLGPAAFPIILFFIVFTLTTINSPAAPAYALNSAQSQEQLFPLFFVPWPSSPEAPDIKDCIWIPMMVPLEAFQDALNGLETSDSSGAVKPLGSGQKLTPETKLSWKGSKPLTLKLPNVADITLNPSAKIEWLLEAGNSSIRATQGSIGLQHKKSGQTLNLKGPAAKPVQIGNEGFNMSKPPAPTPVKSEPEEQAATESEEQAVHEEDTFQLEKVKDVTPEYPEIARAARVGGVVILEITIDAKGNVTTTKIVYGNPLLTEAAIKAVKQWKFKPYLLNGVPIPVMSTVTVNFSVR